MNSNMVTTLMNKGAVDTPNKVKGLVSASIGPLIASAIVYPYFFYLYTQTGSWYFKAVVLTGVFSGIPLLPIPFAIAGWRRTAMFMYYLSSLGAETAFGLFTNGISLSMGVFFSVIVYVQFFPLVNGDKERRTIAVAAAIPIIMGVIFEFIPIFPGRPDNPVFLTYLMSALTTLLTLYFGTVVIPKLHLQSLRSLLTQSIVLVILAPLWGILPILRNTASYASIVYVLILIVGGVGAALIITNTITKPLGELTEVAQKIGADDLSARAVINRQDELGILAQTLNQTAENLNMTINGLERRVSDRTRDLSVASEVSRQITRELDLEKLLPQLVKQTKDGFHLYYVSVFLFDQPTQELLLEVGTGEEGKYMKKEAKSFHITDRPSLVAQAARERKSVVINDVAQSVIHFFNPHLINTKSEAVFPMIVGDDLIGILDLQADVTERFQESDIQIFATLAEQIAIAVRNAQLYREQEHVAEELVRTDLMKTQFLASMSHELRTPLNAIINFTELVAIGSVGEVNESQKEMLDLSLSSSKHLLQLINDVLDISKIQAGKLTLFVEDEVNLYEEISTVVGIAEPLLEKQSALHNNTISFVKEIDSSLPLISCDRRRVRQVLLNVLSNAIKFTEKGSITLRVKKQRDHIAFGVFDTGPGIPDSQQTQIFEPFIQTTDGLKHAGGTGLGLPISRSLIEAHGGRLWLESIEGQGSAFFFTLLL